MRDDKILMVKNSRDNYYYSVGGRVRFGESAQFALRREVREEIGVDCTVGELAVVHENLFYERGRKYHELALFFNVTLPQDAVLRGEQLNDSGLTEKFEWLPIDKLDRLALYPQALKTELCRLQSDILHVVTNEWKKRTD